MDISTLLVISFLWLCLSMRLCAARHLLLVVHELPTTQLNVPGQVAENLKEQIVRSTEGSKKEGITGISGRSTELAKEIHLKNLQSSGPKELSGLFPPIKSVVSVSGHVPDHNKDQHPGFYSDYSLPRTRPPSHN